MVSSFVLKRTPVVEIFMHNYSLLILFLIYIVQMVVGARTGKQERLVKRIVAPPDPSPQYEPFRIAVSYDSTVYG